MEPQQENVKDNLNDKNQDLNNENKEEENKNNLEKYEQDKKSNNYYKNDQQKVIEKKKKYEFVRDERNNEDRNKQYNQNINNEINNNEKEIKIDENEIKDFDEKNPKEWSNENIKKWVQYKKSLGTYRDKEANTDEYEKRDGISLLEIAKSRDTFIQYAGDLIKDKSFSSLLFDDLKERVDIFYRKNLIKSIVNKIVQIRIIRKRVLWQPEINYSVGLRVGGKFIFASNDYLNNFNEKNTLIEVGFSNKWYKGKLIEISDPLDSIDCALLKLEDFNEECETFPILKRSYALNSEIFYFDFPISRLPIHTSIKDKNFKDIKPLEPSIFTGRISYFDENNVEVHLNGSDMNEFDNKSRLFFSCKNGEISGIIKKKSQYHQYLNSNVLYCTKTSTIQAWVDTTLKRYQNPPLWE